jgi:hypothetical protein
MTVRTKLPISDDFHLDKHATIFGNGVQSSTDRERTIHFINIGFLMSLIADANCNLWFGPESINAEDS